MVKTQNVITFHGLSNVGKSTLANKLTRKVDGFYTTPIRKYKRFLEEVYSLPKGGLDTQEGKDKQVTESETVGSILTQNFHFWETHDPFFSVRQLGVDLAKLSDLYDNIVIDSIRKPNEVSLIKNFAAENDINLIVFHIKSERGIEKGADTKLVKCLMHYPPHVPVLKVRNDNLQDAYQEVVDWWRSQAVTDRSIAIQEMYKHD